MLKWAKNPQKEDECSGRKNYETIKRIKYMDYVKQCDVNIPLRKMAIIGVRAVLCSVLLVQ